MGTIFGLPQSTAANSFTSDAAGLQLGDRFFDKRGRSYRFYALTNDLTGNATVANDVMVIASTDVTYPTGLTFDYTTTTGVSPAYTVTNTVANGLDYAAGAPVIAIVAGIMDAAVSEATSAAAADFRGVLVMNQGFHLVRGDGVTETVSRGDHVILGATAGYACGLQAGLAGTDTTAETRGTQRSHIGWAVAADEDTDNLIAADVSVGNF
jgi:hypothetical protein